MPLSRSMQEIIFTVRLFREGDAFVAHTPELDVASCGNTPEDARCAIREAVHAFLEASDEMGTLTAVLEEAGYRKQGGRWDPPELISFDRMAVGI